MVKKGTEGGEGTADRADDADKEKEDIPVIRATRGSKTESGEERSGSGQ